MSLRLRILKRHSSVEEASEFEAFFQVEFRRRDGSPDLDLSIFDVDASCLVRTHAECAVSWLQSPPKHRGGLSVEKCTATCTSRATPGDTDFVYTRSHHVELGFLHEEELREFAQQVLAQGLSGDRPATAAQVREYGRGRLDENDQEWLSATERKSKWAKELRK